MRKAISMIIAIVILSLLTACSTLQPLKETENSRLENQIRETNHKIEELSHKLSIIQFMVDDHQKTLKEVEAALEESTIGGKPMPSARAAKSQKSGRPAPSGEITEKPMPGQIGDAAQLYKQALAIYKNGNYGKAAMIFNSVFENFANHELADNALYWTGECFYAQKNYKGAIRSFKKVLDQFPGGSKVPDSLLKIGYSYLASGDKPNARSFLKKVVKQYPFTPAGSKAGEMLKRIKSK